MKPEGYAGTNLRFCVQTGYTDDLTSFNVHFQIEHRVSRKTGGTYLEK